MSLVTQEGALTVQVGHSGERSSMGGQIFHVRNPSEEYIMSILIFAWVCKYIPKAFNFRFLFDNSKIAFRKILNKLRGPDRENQGAFYCLYSKGTLVDAYLGNMSGYCYRAQLLYAKHNVI